MLNFVLCRNPNSFPLPFSGCGIRRNSDLQFVMNNFECTGMGNGTNMNSYYLFTIYDVVGFLLLQFD